MPFLAVVAILSVSTSEIWSTSEIGGPGGADFRYECADNGYLVAVRARVGAWIDSVQAVCAKHDRATGAMVGHQSEGPVFGGAGPWNMSHADGWGAKCFGDDVVVSFKAAETKNEPYMGLIVLGCVNSRDYSAKATAYPPGRSAAIPGSESFKMPKSGQYLGDECGPGRAAIGIRGRAGSYVDRFGLVCATFGWPAAPKTTVKTNSPGDITVYNPSVRAPSGEKILIDSCVTWGKNCGEAAARRYCSVEKKMSYVISFELTGRGARTYVPTPQNGRGVCDGPDCVGFKEIRCSATKPAPPPSKNSPFVLKEPGGFGSVTPGAPYEESPVLPPPATAESGAKVGNGWDFTHYFPGDFTGDGKADLLVRKANGDVVLYPFNGQTFYGGASKTAGNRWNYTHYWPGQWGGDKRTDMLARDAKGDAYIYVTQADNTTYGGGPKLQSGGWSYTDYIDGDFDGDGQRDMLGRKANGDLDFLPLYALALPGAIASGINYTHYFAADFTGDGRDDLLGRTASGDLMLHEFTEDGLAAGRRVGNGWAFTHYWPGDWTGDGKADLLVRNENGDMLLYSFGATSFYDAPGPATVATGWRFENYFAADFSGDGKIDMIGRTPAGDLIFFPWKGTQF